MLEIYYVVVNKKGELFLVVYKRNSALWSEIIQNSDKTFGCIETELWKNWKRMSVVTQLKYAFGQQSFIPSFIFIC